MDHDKRNYLNLAFKVSQLLRPKERMLPMKSPDYFDKLLLTVDGYNMKFPRGNTPFQIVTRLCEEAGELASAVNHFEGMGTKRLKHGLPDRNALAKEVQDVIRTALSIARFYCVEQELRDSIDRSYRTKIDEGFIIDPLL
jgi:NTP pyrophosphatase (non-canonical NTP hydrolase)